jgi:hypothetical protein
MYAGLALATSVGLFLFTRILIPDAILTLTITLALWALMRALDEEEAHPRRWAMRCGRPWATGLLLKGLIAAVFPVGAGLLYLGLTRQLWRREDVAAVAAGGGICCSWRSRRRGTCWRRCGIRRTWTSRCTAKGIVPRVLLVLLHERARAAVPEPALPAGL